MCTGLWDNCLGLFVVFLGGGKDVHRVPPPCERDAWKRAKGRQMDRGDSSHSPGSSQPDSGENSEGEDNKKAGFSKKSKPGGMPSKSLGSALELLHLKKKAPKPVLYTAAVVAQQEIVTEMQAAEFLKHPHTIYLQEMLLAAACAVSVESVCVTGVVDKLFPKSIFLEDGGIIVQYAVVINYRITINITVLPTEDVHAAAVAFVNEALNGQQAGRYAYLFTMQACITRLSRLKDAQIQLVKVINMAALMRADDPEDASIPLAQATSKSYVYYGNQNKITDLSERRTLTQRRKEEGEVTGVVDTYIQEQEQLKKEKARAERREKRRKEKERARENKENSDDDDDEEDDSDGSDQEPGVSNKSSRSGAQSPVLLAGLGMQIIKLQQLINPTILQKDVQY
jgi:hypothetical protein